MQLTGAVSHAAHNHAAAAPVTPTAPVNESMPHDHSAMGASMPSMGAMPMMGGSGINAIQWRSNKFR